MNVTNPAEPVRQGSTPRVVFLVVQTKISPGWCRMQLSSIMSKVSVVTIGVGMNYTHTKRPQWLLEYINQEGLRDHDVVVVFDGGDTFFTGVSRVQRAVDYFMARTAPTAAKFDATAVQNGNATAPLLFASDSLCFTPQLEFVVTEGPRDYIEKCHWFYKSMFAVAGSIPGQRLVRLKGVKYRYLNAGGFVGRVWALRTAFAVYARVAAMHRNWTCDQSIWSLLHVLSLWQKPDLPQHLRLPYGILSLDYDHEFFCNARYKHPAFSAIHHFPGSMLTWRRILPRYLRRTTWFYELQQKPRLLEETKRLLRCAKLVKVRGADGLTRTHHYGRVCSIGDALSATWLMSPLEKY
ncbi:expression site-associated gene (ESAG-like) protein [Trypanosoma theileri]|uniref:Expression site-associated gene (ESAG-like) protein n=1 Tax=Trypanosoma theileri TaxID=67003 RepID=A0A1X0NEW3_9TRYP|nr:expression site-associated gene (ESAG-like) protein [Trypanosoma theileri]ORC82373.1 expression site-associated gene (ESAG-like) protein [Trypanosoma theileri]